MVIEDYYLLWNTIFQSETKKEHNIINRSVISCPMGPINIEKPYILDCKYFDIYIYIYIYIYTRVSLCVCSYVWVSKYVYVIFSVYLCVWRTHVCLSYS